MPVPAGSVRAYARDPEHSQGRLSRQWKVFLYSSVTVLAIIATYYPVHNYPFLDGVDDGTYVFRNSHVLGPLNWAALKWAFTHSYVLNYDPLTFLAHSLNVRMFQLHAGPHHDVNVLLHVINSLLLFWLLRRSTGSITRSFMVAALFAVHPINVENVAWVSELKTLLSTTFFFLALGAYTWYATKPKLWRMLGVSFLYGLGLLAKPQVITLPFVLLLWDYWPLRRTVSSQEAGGNQLFLPRKLPALVIEKIPLFLIAIVDALITLHAENKPSLERYTLAIRMGSAVRSYAIYVGKALLPYHLAFDYPHPGFGLRWMEVWFALLLLLIVTIVVIAKRQHRYLPVGWFWFLGTMVPMINLVQIDRAALADRYAYTCYVGLFLMICWGGAELAQYRYIAPAALRAISAVVLIVLSIETYHQVGYWKNAAAVWSRTLSINQHNAPANFEFGMLLVRQGDIQGGLAHAYVGLNDAPQNYQALLEIALVERKRNNLKQAVLLYQRALPLLKDKELTEHVLANLGHAYGDLGDRADAAKCFREVESLRNPSPHFAE